MYFFIAQFLGVVGFFVGALSLQNKYKKDIVFFKICSNCIYLFQYIFLWAITGIVMAIIATIRLIVYHYFSKKSLKPSKKVFFFFSTIIIISGILSYVDIFSIFPTISLLFSGYYMWQDNTKVIRLGSTISGTLFFIYGIYVRAYTGAIGSLILMISALVSYYRFERKNINPPII